MAKLFLVANKTETEVRTPWVPSSWSLTASFRAVFKLLTPPQLQSSTSTRRGRRDCCCAGTAAVRSELAELAHTLVPGCGVPPWETLLCFSLPWARRKEGSQRDGTAMPLDTHLTHFPAPPWRAPALISIRTAGARLPTAWSHSEHNFSTNEGWIYGTNAINVLRAFRKASVTLRQMIVKMTIMGHSAKLSSGPEES